MVISRKVSRINSEIGSGGAKSYFRYVSKLSFTAIFLISILALIFNELFNTTLKLNSSSTFLIFYLIVVLSILGSINYSFLQGHQKFWALGLFGLAGIILKIIFSYVLIKLGYSEKGALYGVILSLFFIYLAGFILMEMKYKIIEIIPNAKALNLKALLKEIFPVLIATISLAAMTQLDMVLVNYFFNPNQAGLYAAASTLGKAILYIPGGLVIALYPIVATDKAKNKKSDNILIQATLMTFFACSILAVIYFIYGDLIVVKLYGDAYVDAGVILKWYGVAMIPLALVVVAEQYIIARGGTLFSWIFLLVAPVQVLAICNWHQELWMVLAAVGFFGTLLAISGYLILFYIYKKSVNN